MKTSTIDMIDEIRNLNDRVEAAFSEGDVTDIANIYTDDGVMLPAGRDIIRGREAIQSFWQTTIDMGIKHIKLDTLELEQYDGVAIEMGQYIFMGEGNIEIDHGKYIVVWKHQDDQWKMSKDIWNSSMLAE